jgi:hypothetical protein
LRWHCAIDHCCGASRTFDSPWRGKPDVPPAADFEAHAVTTRIDKAERNRPDHFQPSDPGDNTIPGYVAAALTENNEGGITPEEMAEQTLRAIAEDRFYILPEGGDAYRWKKLADLRLDDIRLGRNPTFIDPNQIKEGA